MTYWSKIKKREMVKNSLILLFENPFLFLKGKEFWIFHHWFFPALIHTRTNNVKNSIITIFLWEVIETFIFAVTYTACHYMGWPDVIGDFWAETTTDSLIGDITHGSIGILTAYLLIQRCGLSNEIGFSKKTQEGITIDIVLMLLMMSLDFLSIYNLKDIVSGLDIPYGGYLYIPLAFAVLVIMYYFDSRYLSENYKGNGWPSVRKNLFTMWRHIFGFFLIGAYVTVITLPLYPTYLALLPVWIMAMILSLIIVK